MRKPWGKVVSKTFALGMVEVLLVFSLCLYFHWLVIVPMPRGLELSESL